MQFPPPHISREQDHTCFYCIKDMWKMQHRSHHNCLTRISPIRSDPTLSQWRALIANRDAATDAAFVGYEYSLIKHAHRIIAFSNHPNQGNNQDVWSTISNIFYCVSPAFSRLFSSTVRFSISATDTILSSSQSAVAAARRVARAIRQARFAQVVGAPRVCECAHGVSRNTGTVH